MSGKVDHAEKWAAAVAIAAEHYTQTELAVWLNAPQLMLANWTPIQLLGCGRGDELLRVMEGLESGAYL